MEYDLSDFDIKAQKQQLMPWNNVKEVKKAMSKKSQTIKEQDKTQGLTIKWDDSKMRTTYANVINVSSTREEVSIFFGTNQTWNAQEDKAILVQLSDRIVANPYAAKRLAVLLNQVIEQYENRFGLLGVGEKAHKIH